MKKQYNNKIEFRTYTNNKYYDVCFFFFVTPIYLEILFYLAKNRELSGELNVEMCTIGKSKKIQSKKTVS